MIDLHCHTTISDGGDSPTELVTKAVERGLTAIAVTDHDNDSGCDEAVAAGREHGIEVVRGVEISCDVEDIDDRGLKTTARPTMHLLAYFIPEGDNPLSTGLAQLREARANRNHVIVERLNDLGIPVTFEEVELEAGGPGSQIGRPHFAAVMVRHEAVADYQTAFDEYLAKGAKAYVGRMLYKPVAAVELMLEAGAVPVLAHPFTLNLEPEDLKRFVRELSEAGLRGIECYHGDWTAREQEPLKEIAMANKLVMSGGSDYHGDMRPDRDMPGGKNGVEVPSTTLEQLREVSRSLSQN